MEHKIYIANRKTKPESLHKEFGNVPIFDVTFAGRDPIFSTLSPMYPHGNLPVPYSERKLTANCLEAIWQGFKVFEHEGARIDAEFLSKSGDSGIKRPSTAKRGKILGHQQGIYQDRPLLSIIEARSFIYAPVYKWQLDNNCQAAIDALNDAWAKSDIVLLEAGNERDIRDIFTPMPHSALLRLYLMGCYPECGDAHPAWIPYTKEEHDADMERRKEEKKARIARQKQLQKESPQGSLL